MTNAAQRTALYSEHLALGGRMTSFAGWELPLYYEATGATVEHRAVRERAGLFDIDHIGQITVSGPDADAFLNAVLTIDVLRIPVWHAHCGVMLYPDGGVVDDLFLYHLDDAWMVVVNAVNRAHDLHWLRTHAAGYRVVVDDISDATYMLALQGPKARDILDRLTNLDLTALPFHTCARGLVAGSPTLVGTTGYAGEYGYELYFPEEDAVRVWRAILAAGEPEGVLPAGLAARDSLRFEAALPLYGHEIGPDIDPITAGVGCFVQMNKGPFIGKDAVMHLKATGAPRRLVGLEMLEPAMPREGYPVLAEGRPIGKVTSGMKSPTLDRFLALALVPAEFSTVGARVEVEVRGKAKRAVVVALPFYTPAYRRK